VKPVLLRKSDKLFDRETVLNQYREHTNSGFAKLCNLMNLPMEVHSKGVYVYDSEGQSYLDMGGYGVFLLGHGHPRVVAAVTRQLQEHAMSSRLLINPYMARSAAALAEICPGNLQYVFFCNSGAEACEAGLKLAVLNGCQKVISTHTGFHGKTIGALSATGASRYRGPFQGILSSCEFVNFGNIAELEQALCISKDKSCVILEPIQAEGGVILPPVGYLRQVREVCDKYNALLIFDEIQCGMGRSGAWWVCELENVVPDILLAGKILSGGCIPVGAMIASKQVYKPFNDNPLLHSSTYGGNPLAMAAVLETINTIKDLDFLSKVEKVAKRLSDGIIKLLESNRLQHKIIFRSCGLLMGLEFKDAHLVSRVVSALVERKIIVCHSLNEHRVLRLTPSPLLSDPECSHFLSIFEYILIEVLSIQSKAH
jgi:putrescine aminotransferase